MVYSGLPKVGSIGAPLLAWHPSPNQSNRLHGSHVNEIWLHVWGGGSYPGVVDWLCSPRSQASAHVVYAGEAGPNAGKASQLVAWSKKAWTECMFNDTGISIESADAIWQGHDPRGFARLARMTAVLLHLNNLPAHWVRGDMLLAGSKGFCRHGDGGARACGHLYCPTSDMDLWRQFVARVTAETRYGRFRRSWGR